jgi:DNA-binding MurR/RpiR family transcriptional regulator
MTATEEAELARLVVEDRFKSRPRTTADLATIYGVSESTITRALRRLGDEIVRRRGALRREVRDRDRTGPPLGRCAVRPAAVGP